MKSNPEVDPKLDAYIQALHRTAPRNPQLAARAREKFLAEAAQITYRAPSVSISMLSRLDKWMATLKSFRLVNQKERNPMFNLFITVLLVLGAVLGGGATTVAAAQTAQPDQTLYPVKTWSEDLRLGWETDPQAKFDLALKFTVRRAEEIKTMLAAGGIVPEPVLARFENQQQQELQMAAGMPDDLAKPAFEQVHNQSRQQVQVMQQLQLDNPACEQIRARVQTMLQVQVRASETGIENPDLLRDQLRLRDRDKIHQNTTGAETIDVETGTTANGNPWTTGTPTPGSGYGPGPGGSQNPWTDVTPTPGSGYGSGESQNPWTDETPVPGSGYGLGESQNPWTDETPVPGSGYGPGSGDCTSNCAPAPNSGNKP